MISPSPFFCFLRLRRGTRLRRRCTTATVAAPATNPVAASAAAWRAGTGTGSAGSTTAGAAGTGSPSTTSSSWKSSGVSLTNETA